MKKLFLLLSLATMITFTFVGPQVSLAHSVENVLSARVAQDDQPQISDEDQAAYKAATVFAKDHNLTLFYRSQDSGKTWDFAFGVNDENGAADEDSIKWIVYSFPSIKAGVEQLEADFTKYPNGSERTYGQDAKTGQ